MSMDSVFCAGELRLPQPPALFFVPLTVDLPVNQPPPTATGQEKDRLAGGEEARTPFPPAGPSPWTERTATAATQSRKPSRFFRAFSGLRSRFQPLPTLPPVDTKKGQGVREHPPPGGTVPRNISFQSFLPRQEFAPPAGAACYLRFVR